jgi:hypothetical protein
MSPLFRRSEEKLAQETAAKGEIERLKQLSVEDLAIELLPGFGPGGAGSGGLRVQQLCTWLVRDFPSAGKFNPLQLLGPVREGLQRLEHAEFVYSTARGDHSTWRITRAGEAALSEGRVEQAVRGTA